jgi:hypothetical protein
MSRSLRTQRDDKGVVALEMVLAVPVLITLIIGAVVLGNALSANAQLIHCARDGARAAALHPDQGLPGCGDPNDEITVTIVSSNCPDGDVTVKATKPLLLRSIPFVPGVLLDETAKQEVTMRCGA